MRIEELHLKNFCGFEELTIQFPESNLAVFIGNNGSGKTTILKSIVLLLSWLIKRIEREKGLGSPIADLDILNGKNFSEIKIKLKDNNELFEWSLAKTAKGKKKQAESKLTDVSKLADIYRTHYTENDNSSFPLIIYYPVERSVLDVPLRIKNKHEFSQLDGYDNALSQGVDFRRFFEWHRNREDIENENFFERNKNFNEYLSKLAPIISRRKELENDFNNTNSFSVEERNKEIERLINKEIELYKDYEISKINSFDHQLKSVRQTIKNFIPNFDDLRIMRKPKLRMLVNKLSNENDILGTPLDILQLSQGEKSLMALVGDIARRLAMMNPTLENPLEGEGIVLLDEIELHLHPKWQRTVIPNLQKTFPNIQFIITTHSPQVLSNVKKEEIFILENRAIIKNTPHTQGRDSNSILYELFGVEERPKEYRHKINAFYDALEDEKFDEAKQILAKLTELFGEQDSEIVRANLHLNFATE